ncbi:MAG TPA: hypothetical protein VD996_12455 [Chitinophagaceae bacterium]|nr:hypothetical protein [Chitinophagaceae bacterium]
MKKVLILSSLIFVLFSSFVKEDAPAKKLCGPSFRIQNNHASVTITGYQIWEMSGGGSSALSGLNITPGTDYVVSGFLSTGSFAVRLFYATPTSGSMSAWNDMPNEYDCANLLSASTRSTVMLNVSTCSEVLVNFSSFNCP